MAKHALDPRVAYAPIRIVPPSSRSPRPHWVRTVVERREVDHPVHGAGVVISWTPERIADVPPPWRTLRRRDRRPGSRWLRGVMPGGLLRFNLSAPDVDKPAEVG